MDLAEELPAISAAAVTSKQRCRPHAALAFRAGRQWVITRPGSCGRGRGGPSSDGNVTTGLGRERSFPRNKFETNDDVFLRSLIGGFS